MLMTWPWPSYINRVRHLFSKPVLLPILNSLVFSKFLYCSAVCAGTFKQNQQKLKLVQNFAACVLTYIMEFDHITTVLQELGWLSIKDQPLWRDAIQMYQTINGYSPLYLSSLISKKSDVHNYNTRQSVYLERLSNWREWVGSGSCVIAHASSRGLLLVEFKGTVFL